MTTFAGKSSKIERMVSLEGVAVAFGGEDLFHDVSLLIGPHDRIGLVGRNGTGKSTLFRVISGDLAPSAGRVTMPAGVRIGHLAQHIERHDSRTVLEEALTAFEELQALERQIAQAEQRLAACPVDDLAGHERLAHQLAEASERYHMLGGGRQEAQAERTLLGLGFEREQLAHPTATLSGGWRMRVELAKILLQAPQLLLLDEPTNHLDIESIEWLEAYLKEYSGALILVSHDRRFLDTVTTRTLELSLGQARSFDVPYTQFVALRAEQRAQQEAAYRNQQKLIEKNEAFIEKFRYKPTKSNQVQSRIKLLEKLERIEVDDTDNSSIHFRFPPAPRSGDVVVNAEGVAQHFGQHEVFRDVSIALQRGEKVAFVGRNGEGKTTMARIIQGELAPSAGHVTIGHNVSVGYFAQNQEAVLDPALTVFETIDQVATGPVRTKIRDLLGAFLFRGDDVDKPVRVLSGGERNRLAMVKLMLYAHNLLVLDEPTNHLDIQAKEILKQALKRYDGTLIIVSHDRDFLSGLTDKVYEFSHGRVREHMGDIDTFLESRRLTNLDDLNARPQTAVPSPASAPAQAENSREAWKQRKQRDNEIRRRQQEIAGLERDVEKCEEEMKRLESLLAAGEVDASHDATYQQYAALQSQHARLLKTWEEKMYELEIIEDETI